MSEGKVGKMQGKEATHVAAPPANMKAAKAAGENPKRAVGSKGKQQKSGSGHGKHPGKTTVVAKVSSKPAKGDVPEGLPKKYFLKSTFNTHDIMHSPVEKTIRMLDKILAGEKLFTM